MTLVEFLLARIDDDEERVRVPNWYPAESVRDGYGSRGETCDLCGAYMDNGTEAATERAWGEHLTSAHQSARVRAECAAKRVLLDEYDPLYDSSEEDTRLHRVLGAALRRFATAYADHPDYDPAWRVDS